MPAERTVAVGLTAKVSGFIANMKLAAKSAGDFGKQGLDGAVKHKAALDDLALGAGVVGGAMLLAGGIAVKAFAGFDSAMSKVQAATHETASNMDLLREASLQAGADTAFSATEAANAVGELAKAGVTTKDILGGGLKGALDLAAAGELEVADAGEIAATAMNQFKLQGKDVPHIADLLAAAAGKAQGEVSDMAMALKQSGLVASQMGLSIEETTGTLAAFASAGLIGSDAGTSFRTMLLRLSNPSAEAADLLAKYNIQAYDAQGNFVSMESLAGQLQGRLGGLSQAERDAAFATIFGSDAIRAANVLYTQGEGGIRKWIGAVNDQGFAAETAAIKMDNLAGDIEKFLGSLETALIGVGEGANGPLRDLVQNATAVVDAFGKMPDGIQQSLVALVGGGGLILLGVAGMVKLVGAVASARASLTDLGKTGKVVGGLLKASLVYGGIYLAAQGLDVLADKMNGLDGATGQLAKEFGVFEEKGRLTGNLLQIVGTNFEDLGKKAKQAIDPSFKEKLDDAALSLIFADSASDNAKQAFEQLDRALASMDIESAKANFTDIRAALVNQGLSLKEVNALFPQYREAVKNSQLAVGESTPVVEEATTFIDQYGEATEDTAAALGDLKTKADELLTALNGVININLAAVESKLAFRDSIRQLTEAQDENNGSLRAGTEAGDANRTMLAGLVGDAQASADAVYEKTLQDKGAEAAAKAWNSTMSANIGTLIREAEQAGINKEEVAGYVAGILGIPEKSLTNYSAPGLADVLASARDLDAQADALDGRKVQTYWFESRTFQEIHERITRNKVFGQGPGAALGGEIHIGGMPGGGRVRGPGGPRDDKAGLFRLSNGEFVVNAEDAQKNLDLLARINAGLPAFSTRSVRGMRGGTTGVTVVGSGPDINYKKLGTAVAQAMIREGVTDRIGHASAHAVAVGNAAIGRAIDIYTRGG